MGSCIPVDCIPIEKKLKLFNLQFCKTVKSQANCLCYLFYNINKLRIVQLSNNYNTVNKYCKTKVILPNNRLDIKPVLLFFLIKT